MFRLQDNVPQNYVSQSRDFQLFCRLYDYINNGVKFDIDSMLSILDPMQVKNNILKLLAIRVGFFPIRDLDDTMMRYIISTFPLIIKLKGTKRGISACIDTVLRARNVDANYSITIQNDEHTIDISIQSDFDRIALEEYLRYIIPPGYITTLSVAQGFEANTQVDQISIIHAYIDPNSTVSQVTNDYGNALMPTYSLETEMMGYTENDRPAYYTSAGTPVISTEETEDYSITTFDYYEKGKGVNFYEHKTLTMKLPKQPDIRARKFGTIMRSEVIGSDNDASYASVISNNESSYIESKGKRQLYYDNDTAYDSNGHYLSDNLNKEVKYLNANNVATSRSLHLAHIFTDLLEQENNQTLVLRLKQGYIYNFALGEEGQEGYVPAHAQRTDGISFTENDPEDFNDRFIDQEKGEKYCIGSVKITDIDIPQGVDNNNLYNTSYTKYLIDDLGTVAIVYGIYPQVQPDEVPQAYIFKLFESGLGNSPVEAEEYTEEDNNGGNNG